MRLWRLTRAPHVALDGAGAMKHGGRYTPPGVPVVPLASEAGLAVLIALRYLPAAREEWPDDFVLGWTAIDATPERLAESGDDTAVRAAVESWIAQERSLLAAVSSRVLPEADVVLFNPRHPRASEVQPLQVRPFDFAACLHVPPMLDRFRSAP
jgi:RES domain-containing protein